MPPANGAPPSVPADSPLTWAVAAWVRRNGGQPQTAKAAVSTVAAAPASTAATVSGAAAVTPVTAVGTNQTSKGTSNTVAAGKASVGTAETTTGAVSGSLNFTTSSHSTLTYSVAAQPATGTVTVNSNGTYIYTPTQLARDTAAVTAGSHTAAFTVTATNGHSTASETVTVPISPTVITGDSTAALQDVFNNMAPGSTLKLASGTFVCAGVLTIDVAGVTIEGNKTTLYATNDATSAVEILSNNVTMEDLTLAASLTGPRYYDLQQHKLVIEGNHDTVSNVTVDGSAGAGVYVYGAGWFTLNDITVNDSRADGISMTDGAHNGVVNDPVTNNTGDDGVSVVSYVADGAVCSNITINNPVVNGTTWGRGVTVVGGQDITFNNIKVSNTNGAGVYVASEPSYNTMGVNNVTINGGTITGANYNAAVVHGAILVYAGNVGQPVTNVTVENLSVSGTATTAQREIGLIQETGSSMGGIAFKNIAFDQSTLPLLYSNVPSSSYSGTGITVGGAPVALA